ncbi:extracellular solute-binding protein [Mesorhizobium sp. CAU 1741]|uniref:extracellular solute-binding protein n=1 Tax=Mesorhizobium sp. CAU 1741 TaxID=3140366 RepID=UPI00325A4BD1
MTDRQDLSRRRFLFLAGATAGVPLLMRDALAQSPTDTPLHGLSAFGNLKRAAGFPHFDYVDPDAPKGGRIITMSPSRAYNQSFNTFDTLNMYVLRGNGAFGMPLTFASLMQSASDEIGAAYAYAAESVTLSADRLALTFPINPSAKFHDGSPITAKDVVFSLTTLRDSGHENLASDLRQIESVEALDEATVSIRLAPDTGMSTVLTIVAGCPIFSAAWWEGREFTASLSEGPLGSGPYRVDNFAFGSYIEFDRVEDFWGADHPTMRGRYNFDRIRYDYYRDRNAAFEAFKGGKVLFREEFTSRNWAVDYNFPAIQDGRVKREELPDEVPSGGQAWFFNTRREKFSDPLIRQAIGLLFDFEWINANIMYDSFERSSSFYEKTDYEASGLPGEAELAILEPLRESIPAAAFVEPYVAPVSDGSGRDRAKARQALELFTRAGCKLEGRRLLLPSGEQLSIEFLDDDNSFEPHHNAFIRNLRQLGIDATYRVVDASQYSLRVRDFDFDMTVARYTMPLYPDRFIRQIFGSSSAASPGSYNLAGVANPAIDAILDAIIEAETQDEFTAANRAMDRVLRAEHYFIFQWHKATRWIAYWDHYDRPATKPRYDTGVLDTWWTRPDQVEATGMSG